MPTPRDLTQHALQAHVWADLAFGVVLALGALVAHLRYADDGGGPVVLLLLVGAIGLLAHALVLKLGLDLAPHDEG